MGWATPEEHPAIQAAIDTYSRVVTPHVCHGGDRPAGILSEECRVGRWIFSTDGVGFPILADTQDIDVPASKNWVYQGEYKHPAMFGFGPGVEQNTHKIGECVDTREMEHAIAFMARFPSLYATQRS